MRLQRRIINLSFSFQPTVVGFLVVQCSSISFMSNQSDFMDTLHRREPYRSSLIIDKYDF